MSAFNIFYADCQKKVICTDIQLDIKNPGQ